MSGALLCLLSSGIKRFRSPSRTPSRTESGSRCPVEAGVEAWGMKTSSRGGKFEMCEVRPIGSGFDPLSTVVFSHTSSPAGVGRHGADMAKTTPVCFSPDRSAPWSSGEGPERGGQSIAGSLVLDGRVWFSDIMSLLAGPAMADPSEEGVENVGWTQLTGGFSAGVLPRSFLCWSYPIHTKGVRGCHCGFPHPTFRYWDSGEVPAGRAFPLWCMPDEACDSFQSPNLESGCGP